MFAIGIPELIILAIVLVGGIWLLALAVRGLFRR